MLRFLHSIEGLNDYQLRKKVVQKIQTVERKSRKFCPTDTEIGFNVGYNQEHELNCSDSGSFVLNCIYGQFVRPDTKIIYGLSWDLEKGTGVNDGNYYYMDDQEYLYDFCRFVQDKEIMDEYEFFGYVRDFLKDYFGYIKKVGREQMHRMILKNDVDCFDPVQDHSVKDFKGKGNAMCSEYASMAHNILKLFDLESYLVVGTVILNGANPSAHAYNLITFQETATGEIRHAVIDFINGVDVFDVDFTKIGEEPFIGFFDELDQPFINQFVNGEKHLQFDEYRFMLINDTVFRLGIAERSRDYYIDDFIYANAGVNCCKTYTKEKNPML